jgi:hypothetical protein
MRVIDQIANLILEDPYITASGIARKLGYAEEKTVYYWISKHRYHGLVAFKRAVLSGQFRPQTRAARETNAHYGRIPIVDRFDADGQPIYSGEMLTLNISKEAHVAWRYPGPAIVHFLPQDFLILTPLKSPPHTPWVAGLTAEKQMALRVMAYSREAWVTFDPDNWETDPHFLPLYQIIQLIRYF